MSGLFTIGALLGAFFYIWAKPAAGRKGQSKITWEDGAVLFLAFLLLGQFE